MLACACVRVCARGHPFRRKLSLFCQVDEDHVIAVKDVSNTYHVPLVLAAQRMPELLFARLKLTPPRTEPLLAEWTVR